MSDSAPSTFTPPPPAKRAKVHAEDAVVRDRRARAAGGREVFAHDFQRSAGWVAMATADHGIDPLNSVPVGEGHGTRQGKKIRMLGLQLRIIIECNPSASSIQARLGVPYTVILFKEGLAADTSAETMASALMMPAFKWCIAPINSNEDTLEVLRRETHIMYGVRTDPYANTLGVHGVLGGVLVAGDGSLNVQPQVDVPNKSTMNVIEWYVPLGGAVATFGSGPHAFQNRISLLLNADAAGDADNAPRYNYYSRLYYENV